MSLDKKQTQEAFSPFHQLIIDRFGYYESRYLHLKMDLPSHPITKAYKNPEQTPHKILIAFSIFLDMHPNELIREYQLGKSRISDIERMYHKKQYESLSKP